MNAAACIYLRPAIVSDGLPYNGAVYAENNVVSLGAFEGRRLLYATVDVFLCHYEVELHLVLGKEAFSVMQVFVGFPLHLYIFLFWSVPL